MGAKRTELIKELMCNSRRSDRELAKSLGLTQPTVGKLRKGIEKDKSVSQYSAIPNLSRLGMEIIAFTLFEWTKYGETKKLQQFEEFVLKQESVFFAAPGEGFDGRTKIFITIHNDYADFEKFLRLLRAEWADNMDRMDTFVVSSSNILKNFDFRGVTKKIQNDKKLA